jgi:glycosyltransferase involved in cell wall biosynthesis
VIIPNFNRGELLRETLGSLINQDYTNWEAIVIDDGSSDSSEAVATELSKRDERIRFVKRDRLPGGAPVCRNIGTDISTGEFLIFLDSDDLLLPFSLTERVETIRRQPGDDFWVFPMRVFRDNPEDSGILWNIDNKEPDLKRFLLLDAPWQTTGPIWRREAVLKIGGFTEGLACWQDVDFHLKALIGGLRGEKYYGLPPDALYRKHETQSISQGSISSPAKLESRKKIFITHSEALLPVLTPDILEGLAVLGGNIAIGSAKALQPRISWAVIRFGRRKGVFSSGEALKLEFVLLIYLLRLNRISAVGRLLGIITRKYRQDNNIGKHTLTETLENGNKYAN